MLGKEGAMACTVAVETVIGEHYDRYDCLYDVIKNKKTAYSLSNVV